MLDKIYDKYLNVLKEELEQATQNNMFSTTESITTEIQSLTNQKEQYDLKKKSESKRQYVTLCRNCGGWHLLSSVSDILFDQSRAFKDEYWKMIDARVNWVSHTFGEDDGCYPRELYPETVMRLRTPHQREDDWEFENTPPKYRFYWLIRALVMLQANRNLERTDMLLSYKEELLNRVQEYLDEFTEHFGGNKQAWQFLENIDEN